MEEEELEKRLRAHSCHFASMVELIPAKFYCEPEPGDAQDSGKYWVNKRKKKTPKEVAKKAKRMKLDPARKSVAELQTEVVNGEADEGSSEGKQLNGFSVENVRSSSLSDLQERLKAKIESLRNNRKVPPEGGASEKVAEKVAVKRQKKVDKRKRDKELRKKKLVSGGGGQSGLANGDKMRGVVKASSNDEDSDRVVFSKFDFSAPVVETEVQLGKKKSRKRDYKRLLAKAEATQKKLDEVKRNDERRGRELERKLQWQKALDMARGTKLKDDPKLLKKTSKRIEKRKGKSKKKWEERKDSEREGMEKRQEKRKRNIDQRRDQVKERKIKKRAKKSGTRKPGF